MATRKTRKAYDPVGGGTFYLYPYSDQYGPVIEYCKDGRADRLTGGKYVDALRIFASRARASANRKARDEAMRSCGLVKVRGALGGVYWE